MISIEPDLLLLEQRPFRGAACGGHPGATLRSSTATPATVFIA